MTLAPMLKEDGKVIGDFSLATLDDDRFLIIGSGAAEAITCGGSSRICQMMVRWIWSHNLGLVGLTLPARMRAPCCRPARMRCLA